MALRMTHMFCARNTSSRRTRSIIDCDDDGRGFKRVGLNIQEIIFNFIK
jgi:hypothetical protein